MKAFLVAVALTCVSLAGSARAQSTDHSAHHGADLTAGEVRRVNKAQNKITLRHGEIKSLDMPAMTMVFEVRDAKLLDGVKPGDKVLFRVVKETNGAFVVTDIRPAP